MNSTSNHTNVSATTINDDTYTTVHGSDIITTEISLPSELISVGLSTEPSLSVTSHSARQMEPETSEPDLFSNSYLPWIIAGILFLLTGAILLAMVCHKRREKSSRAILEARNAGLSNKEKFLDHSSSNQDQKILIGKKKSFSPILTRKSPKLRGKKIITPEIILPGKQSSRKKGAFHSPNAIATSSSSLEKREELECKEVHNSVPVPVVIVNNEGSLSHDDKDTTLCEVKHGPFPEIPAPEDKDTITN